jgi:phosphoribosylformimino-5-aminoimidazole carboxamide ribotide isomerase
MLVIPSLDLVGGRSRLVYWPGAASGTGTPTDRPDRIARAFVAAGAGIIHLVDLDGARVGRPANLEAIGQVARAVAAPIQLAGGVDGPEQIELAFAAGATRVVLPLWAVADDADRLAACLRIAGDWLAVGLDARTERLGEYPWKRPRPPTIVELVRALAGDGIRRFVLGHGGSEPDLELVGRLAALGDVEILVAGGVTSAQGLARLRTAGVAGVILGEALFAGAIDLAAVLASPRPGTASAPENVAES